VLQPDAAVAMNLLPTAVNRLAGWLPRRILAFDLGPPPWRASSAATVEGGAAVPPA